MSAVLGSPSQGLRVARPPLAGGAGGRGGIVSHPFLLPFVRLELLIRSIRTPQWDSETWPAAKAELRRALEWN